MDLRFAHSANRHGISNARAAYVIEHCAIPQFSGHTGPADSVMFLGLDSNGVPLEILAVELPSGVLLVIHAMGMRRDYLRTYTEVMRWHES